MMMVASVVKGCCARLLCILLIRAVFCIFCIRVRNLGFIACMILASVSNAMIVKLIIVTKTFRFIAKEGKVFFFMLMLFESEEFERVYFYK